MAEERDDVPPVDALLAAVRAGDERAVAAFVARYEGMLRQVLRVRKAIPWLQSLLESQDLVQSVFIQVVAEIRDESVQFSDEEKLEAYLRTVGRSRLRDHIRRLKAAKRNRQRTLGGGPDALAQLPDTAPSPSGMAEVREQVERVEGCTAPDDLQVIRDHADGAEWQQLAAERNTTPEALRKRIERIRQRIRNALGPDGVAGTEE
jgi:RNA polymerase sigma factor (sigma-70 family)